MTMAIDPTEPPAIDPGGWDDPADEAVQPALAHDPTGTEVAERVAARARGLTPTKRRRTRRPTAVESAWSAPGPSTRDPQLVGTVLNRVLRQRGWQRQVSVVSLLPRWAEFVGDVNAAHTRPESYEAGRLLIRAESTTWATALRTMAPRVIQRLNEALGQDTITSLQIVGPQPPSWKKGKRSVPGRGPRDTYG